MNGYVELGKVSKGDIGPIKAGWPDMGSCSRIGDGGDALMANTEWPPLISANKGWPDL